MFPQPLRTLLVKARETLPLTGAGFALLLGAAALIFFVGAPESDLFALSAGGGFFILILFCCIETIALYFRNRGKLDAHLRLSDLEAFSQTSVPATISLEGLSLFPLFQLEVTPIFSGESYEQQIAQRLSRSTSAVQTTFHVLRGSSSKYFFRTNIRFPHRGLWSLSQLHCRIGDRFGLTAIEWRIGSKEQFEISPRKIELRPLPIVAASARSGDELTHTRERTGDPYDTKPYDPGEGIKRILWKTYARTGELIVRRPEPAVIPEGEVPLYLIARREDDVTASALLGYVRQLERQMIQILFGVDGETSSQASEPVRGEAIISRLVKAAWSPLAGTGQGFRSFLAQLEESRRFTSQVIVFGPANNTSWIYPVMNAATEHHLQVTLALVTEDLDRYRNLSDSTMTEWPGLVQAPHKRLAFLPNLKIGAWGKNEASERTQLMSAIQIAEQSGAHVLVCEMTE